MKTLTAGKPITINKFTIIPIEETRLYAKALLESPFIYASKRPKALILINDEGSKAFDMNFNEVPLESLTSHINGLKELIKNKKN